MTTTMTTEKSSLGVQVFDGLPRLPCLPCNARDVEIETREADGLVSPGVYTREFDFSAYAPPPADKIALGFRVIGINDPLKFEPKTQIPTEIKSSDELQRIFGSPGSPSPQG
jgi:hypothetical protein